MKSFNGKVILGLVSAAMLLSLGVGNAFAGDRDSGWYRDHHRAHYVIREYRPVCVQPVVTCVAPAPVVVTPAPVVVEPAPVVVTPAPVVIEPAPAPVVVAPAPVVVAPAPVVRERIVVRHRHWSFGLYLGF